MTEVKIKDEFSDVKKKKNHFIMVILILMFLIVAEFMLTNLCLYISVKYLKKKNPVTLITYPIFHHWMAPKYA